MTYSLFEFAKEHAEELVVTETPAVPEQVRTKHREEMLQN